MKYLDKLEDVRYDPYQLALTEIIVKTSNMGWYILWENVLRKHNFDWEWYVDRRLGNNKYSINISWTI